MPYQRLLIKEQSSMSIHLEKKDLEDAYYEASKTTKDWQKPFDEYERIAANKLSKTIGKNMPKVNDGSLAASLIETPMQVLPSLQPGKFTSRSTSQAWVNEIANIIWKNIIVPGANTQASFFDKEQMALYRALKYGGQPRYNFFVSNDEYTGSDWSLPYIRNVKLEPGKFSVDDCDYVFLDIYYTKLQLKRLIQSHSKEKDTTWNVKVLKKLVDMSMTSKEMEEQNINERSKQIHASGIKLTACFNRGSGTPFYMFSSQLDAKDEAVRDWINPDPTGALPITMQYCYENLENPYGIGRAELAGPTQNVLDFMTQAHVFATQVGLQPPKKISGSTDQTNFNSLTFTPDALWQVGQAQIDVVNNTNAVYTQFPNNFGLYKTQLQTLQGRTDGSVSAEAGNPSFSKTQAGVEMQQDRTNSQDNYLRNKADVASGKMAEKMMNVHMANMQGADILQVAKEDRDRLVKAGYFDDNPDTETPSIEEVPILYDELMVHEEDGELSNRTFKFEFDPRPEADEDEKNRWVELIDIATSNPNVIPAMAESGYEFNLGEAFKKVIAASGADSWDKVLVELSPEEQEQAKMQQQIQQIMQEQGVDEQTATAMVQQQMGGGEEEMLPEEELPPDEQMPIEGEVMEEPLPQDQQAIIEELQATMQEYDLDEEAAGAVLRARREGYDEEEIVRFLMKGGE